MDNQVYHRAKTWQLGMFALNNSATNCYMFLMMYISYYATGIAVLGVAIVGIISTATRLWDAVTDPIIGFFMDRTDGKFGKFRPFMVLGNIILAVSVLVIYGTTHLIPESFQLIYYILMYMIYIIGYTFQTACTKAGQACLTNDPAQRPTFTLFDTIWGAIVYAILPIVASGPLYTWAGGFTPQYFMAFCVMTVIISGVLTLLAVIGIWEHDRHEFFGVGEEKGKKVSFKDYLDVLAHNRALQMLIVSGSSDKLAASVKTSSVLMVVLFGILYGDYSMYGTASRIVIVPSIIVAILGVGYAAKKGMKKMLVQFTIYDIVVSGIMFVMAIYAYSTGKTIKSMGAFGVAFIIAYIVLYCVESMSSSIVIPMIADCSDYETVRTGRYMPGMMSTVFSFVDKLISSLATTVISLGLVAVGYNDVQPVAEDPMTKGLFIFLLMMYFGIPFFGWVCNIVSMKYYPLSKEKTAEIQEQIAQTKAKA